MFAPIVLFVYNRPFHTKEVIESLARNTLAKKSSLYIFSDGPKNTNQEKNVKEVRDYIKTISSKQWFSEVHLICSEKNMGLAPSIISGVTKIINNYKKIIVVEDDSKTSPDFLEFMNNALNYYEHNSKIWSIGAYSFINQFPDDYLYDIYIMGRTCSYAWATWLDRWQKVDWNVSDYKNFRFSISQRTAFNHYGNDRSLMLDSQQAGRTASWAIRFCYAMYKHKMYTVYPRYSRIKNIGQDGTGIHFKKVINAPDFLTDDFINEPHNIKCIDVEENPLIYKQFIEHFNLSLFARLKKIIAIIKFKYIDK